MFSSGYSWFEMGIALCWPKNPEGSAKLTVTATSVALFSQLVEAFVARKYFTDPDRGPQLMTAASIFEAAGVLIVSFGFITYPAFALAATCMAMSRSCTTLVAGVVVILGAIAEIVSGRSKLKRDSRKSRGTVSRQLPEREAARDYLLLIYYSGAFASAAIWLGSAVLEVVVATFLVWRGEGVALQSYDSGDWGIFSNTLASLLAVEVLALVVMWAAKFLWTRGKLLLFG